jgi:hypothetical protein
MGFKFKETETTTVFNLTPKFIILKLILNVNNFIAGMKVVGEGNTQMGPVFLIVETLRRKDIGTSQRVQNCPYEICRYIYILLQWLSVFHIAVWNTHQIECTSGDYYAVLRSRNTILKCFTALRAAL